MRPVKVCLALCLAWVAALHAADPTPLIPGRFNLSDARSGLAVTQDSYPGRYRLVFFGFTHCPLTCPLGLQTIGEILTRLGPDAAKVKCLFITIDPARDSAKVVSRYLSGFDPRITGLVGSPKAIEDAKRNFRLESERIGGGHDYTLDHPAIIYLIRPNGNYIRTLPSDGDAGELSAEVRQALRGL